MNANGGPGSCSGREVARRMSNRTFNVATGEMFINAARIRNLDLHIYGFNSSTRIMQVIRAVRTYICLNFNTVESPISGQSCDSISTVVSFYVHDSEVGMISVAPGSNVEIESCACPGMGDSTAPMFSQRIGSYEWSVGQLEWDLQRRIQWPTADGLPPNNTPPCGYSGDQGKCRRKGAFRLITLYSEDGWIVWLKFQMTQNVHYFFCNPSMYLHWKFTTYLWRFILKYSSVPDYNNCVHSHYGCSC